MAKYIPRRGDIVWLNLDPATGHEQAGTRPVLVVSPHYFNRSTGLAYVVPITSQQKGYPSEVAIKSGRIQGMALVSALRSIDWRQRRPSFADVCPPDLLKKVQGMILSIVSDPDE